MEPGTKIFWIVWLLVFTLVNVIRVRKKTRHQAKYNAAKRIYRKINDIYQNHVSPGRAMSNRMWILSYLRKIDPFVFEELILYSLKKKGFRIKRNRRYTGDGGIDGRAKYHGEKFLVQAKRYSDHINLQHVKEFIDVCHAEKKRGFFVHTGKTGEASKEIIRKNPQIILLSGEGLYDLFIRERCLRIDRERFK